MLPVCIGKEERNCVERAWEPPPPFDENLILKIRLSMNSRREDSPVPSDGISKPCFYLANL